MTAGEKELAIRAFKRGETPVLALSLKSGGVGLNLQEASYVFHFDRWWNPAVERQAEDRAHRHGQRLPVTVYRLVSPQTIEERACALLREKEALFRRVVDDAPAPESSALTVAELFGLLDLEVPERLRGGTDRGDRAGEC
jgi:SNF2 family DNA or RNA helicase